MRRTPLLAVGICLLVSAVAWTQVPKKVTKSEAPPYRDVLKGLVGRECRLNLKYGVANLFFQSSPNPAHKLVAAGSDFVHLRSERGRDYYYPLARTHVTVVAEAKEK